jgi:hypothetical protein
MGFNKCAIIVMGIRGWNYGVVNPILTNAYNLLQDTSLINQKSKDTMQSFIIEK